MAGLGVDPLFDHMAEMADEALHRPGRGIAERADGVALDLLGHVEQHVDLALLGLTLGHPLQHPPHPAGALAARRALAAAFMLVEMREPAMARIMSVDLSMTITAAVPSPI